MDRLSVLCFGGTYGLALACDLARFAVRGTARWWATLGLTTLAWVVQTAYLGNLAYEKSQLPVATVFESLLVLSWILAAVALYLIVRSPKPVAVGVFVLPVVLALIVVAGFWAPRDDWAESGWGGASHFWGSAHGLLYLVGAVASCVAFAAGLMYLAQSDRLKHKRPPRFGFKLPSLEESERLNRGAITVAFPFLTAGLLVGVVMEVALRQAGHSRLGWSDPKVVSGVLVWLIFAGLLHARFRPEMRGRRVMLFTIVAFLCLAFATIGVDLMHITSHGVPRPQKKDSGQRTRDSGFRYVAQDLRYRNLHGNLVPTLRAGMPSWTLRVLFVSSWKSLKTTRSVADGIPTEDRGNEEVNLELALSPQSSVLSPCFKSGGAS